LKQKRVTMAAEPEKNPEREKMSAVLSVRFAADELEGIRALADRAGVSVSSYVRQSVLLDPTPSILSVQPANGITGYGFAVQLTAHGCEEVRPPTTSIEVSYGLV
jgi:hypothetical protein